MEYLLYLASILEKGHGVSVRAPVYESVDQLVSQVNVKVFKLFKHHLVFFLAGDGQLRLEKVLLCLKKLNEIVLSDALDQILMSDAHLYGRKLSEVLFDRRAASPPPVSLV